MSTLSEFTDFAVEDFDLYIKFVAHHVILWTKQYEDDDHLVPIAHVKLDGEKVYSIDYPVFRKKFSKADQIKIAAEIVNFANTPLDKRDY